MRKKLEFEVNGLWYRANPDDNTAHVLCFDKYYGKLPERLDIPDTVKWEGNEFFVTTIAPNAFEGCIGLTQVDFGSWVAEIGSWAFRGCTGLTALNIPDSINTIGTNAFEGCTGLTSVCIGSQVKELARDAFCNCPNIETIVVNKNNTIYDSRDDCNAIIETKTNILVVGCMNTVIPDSIYAIGHDAFSGCSRLTALVIPDLVTMIAYDAFYGCSGLKEIYFTNRDLQLRYDFNRQDEMLEIYPYNEFKVLQGAKLYVHKGKHYNKLYFTYSPFHYGEVEELSDDIMEARTSKLKRRQ